MDRYPEQGSDGEEQTDGVELLEDRTRPIGRTRTGNRLKVSLPGAIASAFLVTALAFGAALSPAANRTPATDDGAGTTAEYDGDKPDVDLVEPKADEPDGTVDGDEPKDDEGGEDVEPVEPGPDASDKPDGGHDGDVDQPKDEPTPDEPKAEPTPDEPKDEPEPKPDVTGLSLALRIDGAKVIVDWSACERDNFVAYKVIRSTDSTVTYPRGDNDTLIGAVENRSTTAMADAAPGGKRLWYRVFGVVEWEGNPYTIACASGAKGIETPEPKPEPTPEPKPEIGTLGLTLGIDEGHPWLDWTSCEIDGFDAYKVVRSKDSTVRFPAGDNDVVVAAIGPDGATKFWDKEAPGGTKLWYRVFCVNKTETGYQVLAASATKAVETPASEPIDIPDPEHMGFEIDVTGEGVVLHWEACGGELFRYYKVVRSRGENPSYLPGTDGSEVVAVFENAGVTVWVDGVDAGGTWFYRVQCIGVAGDQKVLLGQTDVRSVTLDQA